MSQRVPSVVGLYLRESGEWRRIAEFRLNTDGHATFRAVDPVEGLVARVWYHQGVDLLGEDRTVLPADGPAFLRALLQPFGFRDYRFRDDSSPGSRSGPARPPRGHDRRTHPSVHRESDTATGLSDCAGCADDREPRRHAHGSRPAAWRLLDSDTVRY
ncbi:hypothetical protein [Nocardia yamanashiensis]|uniref:hypothetical protein n=1 Tax=Nocardia yamanashiensis TaxID=209247 RepID=UPI00082C1A2D|nr:hypothetical protein [Nocardia yamanashiensis]